MLEKYKQYRRKLLPNGSRLFFVGYTYFIASLWASRSWRAVAACV